MTTCFLADRRSSRLWIPRVNYATLAIDQLRAQVNLRIGSTAVTALARSGVIDHADSTTTPRPTTLRRFVLKLRITWRHYSTSGLWCISRFRDTHSSDTWSLSGIGLFIIGFSSHRFRTPLQAITRYGRSAELAVSAVKSASSACAGQVPVAAIGCIEFRPLRAANTK